VSGSYYVGGVVGYNEAGTITNCYNTGTVTGSGDYVGGVVGWNYTGTVSYCYWATTTTLGVGFGTALTNCASFASYSVSITGYTTGTLLVNLNAWVTANQSSYTYNSWGQDSLLNFNSGYPVLLAYFNSGTGVSGGALTISNTWQMQTLSVLVNSGLKYGTISAGQYTLSTTGTAFNTLYYELMNDIVMNDETFTLDEASGIIIVADGVNIGYLGDGLYGQTYNTVTRAASNTWYTSASLTGTLTTSSYVGNLNIWSKIGSTSSIYFAGNFEGNGHSINNAYINAASGTNGYTGMFGYCIGATISNLTINDSFFNDYSANGYVGAFIGYSSSSTINNCNNNSLITSGLVTARDDYYRICGGIVGCNTTSGIIENCSNTGRIITDGCGYDIGGIAGVNSYSSTILNCYNEGKLSTSWGSEDSGHYIGGIGGYNNSSSTIANCYNTGLVVSSGNSGYVGGIGGYNNSSSTIANCYNTGLVSSGNYSYAGGIGGYNNSSSTITNSLIQAQ